MKQFFLRKSLVILFLLLCVGSATLWGGEKKQELRLKVAAIRFSTNVEIGDPTYGRTGSEVKRVAEPLKTTVLLFEDGGLRICIVATDTFSNSIPLNRYLQDILAKELKMQQDHVLVFSSHNHSVAKIAYSGDVAGYHYPGTYDHTPEEIKLTSMGEKLVSQLGDSARRLPNMLEPVSVWYAEESEGRITYNRKGHRADGSTYLMREKDRQLIGKDFSGDIDRQAPVLVFKNAKGQAVAGLVQFTGHPVTSYHPEKLVISGDFPQTATDIVARALSDGDEPVPVGFIQGCAGDVNSKEMFYGGVERAQEFGRMLGETYAKALKKLKSSERQGMGYGVETVHVPLEQLPSKEMLETEIEEMRDFIGRAKTGDQNTLGCVGMNFPRSLSPEYRAALVGMMLPWSEWGLELRRTNNSDTVMKTLDMSIYVIRLGDVGIVGMPCEPFQGIGRRIRQLSPLPLTIPCGYTNGSHGYITDSPNTGDAEYMSAFYRYTKFRPPLRKPAGDVLANHAVEILKRLNKISE